MPAFIDITGQRFGRLVAVERAENGAGNHARWQCACDCGGTTLAYGVDLRKGHTQSCGCLRKELTAAKSTIHGLRHTAEYRIWLLMKDRCLNPNNRQFKDYGARGISICHKWINSFVRFYTDLGERPSSLHTIERKENDKGYEPGNCVWATRGEQNRNKRSTRWITYGGETLTLTDWAGRLGINCASLHERLAKWPIERALTEPVKEKAACR